MTPTEFLQKRNIVDRDKSDLIIGFDNGTKESLIELLEDYHQTKVKDLGLFSVVNSVCPNCGGKVNSEGIFFCSTCESESTR